MYKEINKNKTKVIKFSYKCDKCKRWMVEGYETKIGHICEGCKLKLDIGATNGI